MMLSLAIHPTCFFVAEHSGFVLLLLVLWGATTCLLGFPLFRAALAGYGVISGLAAGWDVVTWLRADPSGGDFLFGMLAGAVVIGLLAWAVDRAAFALMVAWLGASLVASMFSEASWRIGWVAGALLGTGCGVLAWNYVQAVGIFLSSVLGAVLAVFSVALLFSGGRSGEALVTAVLGPEGRLWVGVLLVLLVAGLAGVGMAIQSKLADAVGDTFMPSAPLKRRGRKPRTAEVRPRFTKI